MSDTASDIVRFVRAVQTARANMHHVWNHYTRRKLKVHWGQNVFGPIWTDGGFEFGLIVTGADGQNYELSARLLLPGDAWVVQSEASLEQETEGGCVYPTLRERPERRCRTWEDRNGTFGGNCRPDHVR